MSHRYQIILDDKTWSRLNALHEYYLADRSYIIKGLIEQAHDRMKVDKLKNKVAR